MKFSILNKTSFLLLLASFFIISCDDDMNTIGSSIQPGGDIITIIADTFGVSSETILMGDVYARSNDAVLGKYEDPFFGSIKAEYLFEFKAADSLNFKAEHLHYLYIFQNIDSVQLTLTFTDYVGDSLAPMGVSAYKLTSPLKRDYYTNVNPADYCDMSNVLGQTTYAVYHTNRYISPITGAYFRTLSIDFDTIIGKQFFEESKKKFGEDQINVFNDTDSLRKFFPGIYLSNTFGTGNLIDVSISYMNIFYKYLERYGNHDNSEDTIKSEVFQLAVTPEVIQLNSIQNAFPEPNPLLEDEDAVYLKSPAGVCAQVQFPLQEMSRKIDELNTDKIRINSGKFILKGYSEREVDFKYDFGRPRYVVLVEKDSLDGFFLDAAKRKRMENKSWFYASWKSSTNSYDFGNLSGLITNYRDKIKNEGLDHDPYFVVIPAELEIVTSSYSSSVRQVYNYLKPSTSVLRRGEEHMKFSYIISTY